MLKKLEDLLKSEIDPAFAKRAEFVFRAIEKETPKKILDAGCGRGFYVNAVALYGFPEKICGFDINKKYLDSAKKYSSDKRIRLEEGSIYKIKYPSNYFDFIICSEILEHLGDDRKALIELKRVLKPGGSLAITVPNYKFPLFWDPLNWILMRFFNSHVNKNIWWLAGIWADHDRLYETGELLQKLKDQNFKIVNAKHVINCCWPFSHFLLYGVGKNLVEKFKIEYFSRFNFSDRRKKAGLLAYIFKTPSLVCGDSSGDNGVNICVLAKK